jgi:hypothetical protein
LPKRLWLISSLLVLREPPVLVLSLKWLVSFILNSHSEDWEESKYQSGCWFSNTHAPLLIWQPYYHMTPSKSLLNIIIYFADNLIIQKWQDPSNFFRSLCTMYVPKSRNCIYIQEILKC